MFFLSYARNAERALEVAAEEILAGNPILAPSDTCYGFLADATNEDAVSQVSALKHRRHDKSFLLFVEDLAMMREVAVVSEKAEELVLAYMPGPLTLILPRNPDSKVFGVREGDIGVRIPGNPFCVALVRETKRPLVTTSANPSGGQPSYSKKEILETMPELENLPLIFIEDGDIPQVPPSTIVRVTDEGLELLREGPVVVPGAVARVPEPRPKKPRRS